MTDYILSDKSSLNAFNSAGGASEAENHRGLLIVNELLTRIGNKVPTAIGRELIHELEENLEMSEGELTKHFDPLLKDGSMSKADFAKGLASYMQDSDLRKGLLSIAASGMLKKQGISDPDGTLAVGVARFAFQLENALQERDQARSLEQRKTAEAGIIVKP